jgi:integrase
VKNIRHDQYGTQAHFKRNGHQFTKRWKRAKYPDKKDRERLAREWIDNATARVRLEQPLPDTTPRFETDADTYLEAVTSMPSYEDRAFHILEWARVFKGRDKATITPLEIRTQLERWRERLSASSCNKRRTALMSFYTKLQGRSGYNPVRDVEPYPEYPELRAQHPYTILRILACMAPSKTRCRLRVILTTGWPHAQVKRLEPRHLDLKNARAFVTPRRKGKGRAGGWLPLLPSAVRALEEFVKWDCFGEFSHTAMYTMFQRALGRLNDHRAMLGLSALTDIRPYDARHTFATFLARQPSMDDRSLQVLLMHSRAEQTRRYTEAATMERLDRALAPFRTSTLAAGTTFRGSTAESIGGRTKRERPEKR